MLVKLVLTLGATFVLLLHMQPISYLAEVVTKTNLSPTELRGLRIQLIADAAAAPVVLLAATAISVYKPWGRIGKWRRQQQANAQAGVAGPAADTPTPWGRYLLIAGLVVLLLFVLGKHLLTGGVGHH